jgi:hypothetical protein
MLTRASAITSRCLMGKFAVVEVYRCTVGSPGIRNSYFDEIPTPHYDFKPYTLPRKQVSPRNAEWLSRKSKLDLITITLLSGCSAT